MNNNQEELNKLLEKLESLINRQEQFSKEINSIKEEVVRIKSADAEIEANPEIIIESAKTVDLKHEDVAEETPQQSLASTTNVKSTKKFRRSSKNSILGGVCAGIAEYFGIHKTIIRLAFIVLSVGFCLGSVLYLLLWIIIPQEPISAKAALPSSKPKPSEPVVTKEAITAPKLTSSEQLKAEILKPANEPVKQKSNLRLEKFIGENLINKVGIIIIIIGVSIGVKYAIEHDLLTPLMRIILGYAIGLGLLGFGIKLKRKYKDFSAVLVSGAIAILYVITYSAFAFYGFFPQAVAFVMMLVFTGFTIITAINYNKQIIAIIGMVGAYSIPFLLSNNSDNVLFFFSYISIINLGILILSLKKYWKPLYFSAFTLSWLIFATWFEDRFNIDLHYTLALVFSLVFFVTFYMTFIAFKLYHKEKFAIADVIPILSNSFIYFGFGYSIMDQHEIGSQLLGAFSLFNGLLHFIVSVFLFKQKSLDKNLFYLVISLVLLFITIAIPIQLNGSIVTLIWSVEAALLFWIGRSKSINMYEYLSYPMMVLAVLSLFHDWEPLILGLRYQSGAELRPFINIEFLTSLILMCAFALIYKTNNNNTLRSPLNSEQAKLMSLIVPVVFLSTLYLSIRFELRMLGYKLFNASQIKINAYQEIVNYDLLKFNTIWILLYSIVFVSGLTFLNIKKIKSVLFGRVNLALLVITMMVFLIQGLYELSELRDIYLDQTNAEYYKIDRFYILFRYVTFPFVGLMLWVAFKLIQQEYMALKARKFYQLALSVVVLWILSSELIHWMNLGNYEDLYKLGLSILWGIYALSLVVIGIWKSNQHLRLVAISLFSLTLIKLFFYDIAHLNTISKTIVFVSLGILLLIISFLYNKFKSKITDDEN